MIRNKTRECAYDGHDTTGKHENIKYYKTNNTASIGNRREGSSTNSGREN
jgi:hypothetical protein